MFLEPLPELHPDFIEKLRKNVNIKIKRNDYIIYHHILCDLHTSGTTCPIRRLKNRLQFGQNSPNVSPKEKQK